MILLPNQKFFIPTQAFRSWARDLGKPVVDCGAGIGHLMDHIPVVLCIDIYEREGQAEHVLHMDATTFPFSAQCACLIARPSGGDWIHDTFRAALVAGADVFYVGLPKNYARDLAGWQAVKLIENAGEDGEELWQIS